MSKQRAEILRIITNSDKHLTAEEIFIQCKNEGTNISIATVYRNLKILLKQGAIKKLQITGEPDRFDKTVNEHDHVVCEKCGEIQDIYLEDLKEILESKTGMKINSYSLCMKYICPKCLNK